MKSIDVAAISQLISRYRSTLECQPASDTPDFARALAEFDAARWSPSALARRGTRWFLRWATVTPQRRRLVVCLALTALFVIIPCTVGAVAMATAATETQAGSVGTIDGLSWTGVKDSSGVPLSDYLFATNHGSLFNPGDTALAVVLGLEFAGFMAIVVTTIWLIGYAVSFNWLGVLGRALTAVAHNLTTRVATPLVLAVAATIGALFVAWFVVRGFYAKATMQIATMVAVAVLGITYLAQPLADVLSPQGVLARGRDVGIAVAAGLNGQDNPDPSQVVATMQSSLADNFARHPLQLWNFGHVVDQQPACRAAWSSSVRSGDDGKVADSMTACGDRAAHDKAESPSVGQICTGLLLLIFGAILLLFGVYLAGKVFHTGLEAIYHAMLAIFGFAAGGFIYGPTQTFLVRNVVDTFVTGFAMIAYIVYLGVYAEVLGDLFAQAPNAGMAIIFITGMVMIVAISLLRRLGQQIRAGNNRIVNSISAALSAHPAPAAAAVVGTGPGMAGGGALGAHTMGLINASNAINSSFITAHLFGRLNPLNPLSKRKHKADKAAIEASERDWPVRLIEEREAYERAATAAAKKYGGFSAEGAAAAIEAVINLGGNASQVIPALRRAGFQDEQMIINGVRATVDMAAGAEDNAATYLPLARSAASLELAATNVPGPNATRGDRALFDAYRAQYLVSARRLEQVAPRPANAANVDMAFVRKVHQNWDSYYRLSRAVPQSEWDKQNNDTLRYISAELAKQNLDAATRFMATPSTQNLVHALRMSDRATAIDLITSGTQRGPFTN